MKIGELKVEFEEEMRKVQWEGQEMVRMRVMERGGKIREANNLSKFGERGSNITGFYIYLPMRVPEDFSLFGTLNYPCI